MTSCKIRLNGIESVKRFENALRNEDGEYELVSGRYVIDAKSIMGIFSLDLTKPLELRSKNDDIPDGIVPFLA